MSRRPGSPIAARTPTSAAAFVPDQSRAERKTSYDVADFPMPTGARRSGVSRRSTGWALLTPGPSDDGAVQCETSAPAGGGAARPAADRRARGPGAPCPADRAAVAAWHSTASAMYSASPPRPSSTEPVVHAPAGTEGRGGNGRTSSGRPAQPARRSCSSTPAPRSTPATSRSVGRRRRRGHRRHRAGVGRRRASTWPSTTCSIGRDAAVQAHRRDPRRRRSCGSTPTCATPAPAGPSRASASTSPMPASTTSTACSSTTRRRTAAPTSSTRARCRATPRTPCGSATCSSAPRPRAPTPTSSTATWSSPTAPAPTRCRTSRSRPARS